ncbi:PaaX domain-containing protein, C- domain protein [Epidermidibacterium keratini]|uniref:PaaX domain-containing protein, C-domain protein n=1 Tax=Epidermidibacterium keratini TaxID=1891644 RepID=A0A7L4YSG3_9ACTN|nr:PaaX family transcriptional regulator C-terminal domain-containing protein [Epidermidibacterium keratini]QHC02030.1 PaaX domain-containing protein, C- domain protein [Epidermidibacterium keratini]
MNRVEQERNVAALVRPLSTRSVILSALLGHHPPVMPVSQLVRVGALFDIAEGTIRVALSRMTTSGELLRDGDGYRLNDRLIERQQLQDSSRQPQTSAWDGSWRMVAITAGRRSRSERDAFRNAMRAQRMAELREGLWMRPDNIAVSASDGSESSDDLVYFTSYPRDPEPLVRELWDLNEWSERARALLSAMDESLALPDAFAVSAAVLRHLMVDPLLPAELLDNDWPGAELRTTYASFDSRFRAELEEQLRD